MPDGSWRTSTPQEYEFDVQTRAEEDFLNDSKGKYSTEIAKKKHVLELRKVARQRASTGARLRVIRELLGIPIAFSHENFERAIVVCRIGVNTDALLESPDMRKAAINQALGVSQEIYGPSERNVTPEREALEAPAEEAKEEPAQESAAHDDDPFDEKEADLSEEQKARIALEEWLNSDVLKESAKDLIRATLDDENATLAALLSLIERCKAYEAKKAGVAK
jgi:hypothetical protein